MKNIKDKYFKSWSIKSLLHLWSVATVLAIVAMATIAIYTNSLFTATQNSLAKTVLPLESASRQISGIASSFVTRQNQLVMSGSIEDIEQLTSRQQLEDEFNRHWRQITSLVSSDDGQTIVQSLHDYFQRFLEVDSELLGLTEQQLAIQFQIQQQINNAETKEIEIHNHVEAISGRINLQVSRDKRAIKLAREGGNASARMNNMMFSDQSDIQKVSQSVRLNALTISNLTQKIIQSDNTDNLLSLRDNHIQQSESVLKSNIKQLAHKLQKNAELLELTRHLDLDVHELMNIVIGSDISIYYLRFQQLQNQKMLALGQQKSLDTLQIMVSKLNQLSALASGQSVQIITEPTAVAENARWVIIILSLLLMLGMVRFVISISSRINTPLAVLSSGMHALSAQKFDTRLDIIGGNSEFAMLGADFNSFASNNERLIRELAEAKDSLQIREQHISAILNSVPEAILTLSSLGIIETTNPAAEQVLNADKQNLIGCNLITFFDQQHKIKHMTDIVRQLEISHEFEGFDYHKKPFSMWLSLNPMSTMEDDVWVCVISDITEWRKTVEKLKTTSTELDAILENAMVGIAYVKERKLLHVNSKLAELFACDRDTLEGQTADCLYLSVEAFEQLREQSYEVLMQGDNFECQIQLVRQNGEIFWCALSGKAINADNPSNGTIWLFEDVTKEREKDEKLRELASLDFLTSLPNRGVFHDRLEHALHKAHRKSNNLAVFFLDIDHFKNINDSLGHKAGDLLLREVASRLTECVREDDTVARLGGDEFTVILEDIHSVRYAAKVAEKIIDVMSEPYILGITEVNVSLSIGISLYPADGQDVDNLLRNADAAMYHAKENGRNNFQFYSLDMNERASQRLAMETSLYKAAEQNEFYLHFQPQIDLLTGKLAGAEALLRWTSDEWGDVSPAEFVPILEDTGLIIEVGAFVIEQACKAYMSLKDRLEPDFKMSVNLSGRQFQGGKLASFIKQQLTATGMSAINLELEITESILMDDTNLAVTTLKDLSELGISMAIDDFGTGYSSLSYLKRFPLNVLKIDRSFVRDVNDDADDAAIVDAILAMSRRLDLSVVAEGVETQEQLSFLQEHGCQIVQGYFFSKPLAFDLFREFIDQDVKYLPTFPEDA